MSFPLQIGDRVVPDAPALAALVQQDSGADAGAVVPGQRPAEWVQGLVERGALERRLAVGLAAALLQHPAPETVCEGSRLAARLGEPALGPLLIRALAAHDTALLLQVDPAGGGRSVEDTLAAAAAAVADLSEPALRRPLLEHLRHAGLPDVEIPILCAHGDASDLATWMPAVLAEGVPDELLPRVAARLARGDDGAATLAALVADAPELGRRLAALP